MGEDGEGGEGTTRESSEPGSFNSSDHPLRKKKKLLREQRKQRERVELKMDLPGVSIADEGETGMFSLRTIRGHQVRRGSGPTEGTGGSVWVFGGGALDVFLVSVLKDPGSWLLPSPIHDLMRGDWEKNQSLVSQKARKEHTPKIMKVGRFVSVV